MSGATSHILDCARRSPSCLILPRQPFFRPLDRIIAVLEFRIAPQLLVQRKGSLHPLDHIFLHRAPDAPQAAPAPTALDDPLAQSAERPAGKGCDSTCGPRWVPYYLKKK